MFTNEVQPHAKVLVENNAGHWGIRLVHVPTALFTALLALADSAAAHATLLVGERIHSVRMVTFSGVRQHLADQEGADVYAWDVYLHIKRPHALPIDDHDLEFSLPPATKQRIEDLLRISLV